MAVVDVVVVLLRDNARGGEEEKIHGIEEDVVVVAIYSGRAKRQQVGKVYV